MSRAPLGLVLLAVVASVSAAMLPAQRPPVGAARVAPRPPSPDRREIDTVAVEAWVRAAAGCWQVSVGAWSRPGGSLAGDQRFLLHLDTALTPGARRARQQASERQAAGDTAGARWMLSAGLTYALRAVGDGPRRVRAVSQGMGRRDGWTPLQRDTLQLVLDGNGTEGTVAVLQGASDRWTGVARFGTDAIAVDSTGRRMVELLPAAPFRLERRPVGACR